MHDIPQFWDFFYPLPHLCPQNLHCLSANLGYFLTPPLLCGRRIWKAPKMANVIMISFSNVQIRETNPFNRMIFWIFRKVASEEKPGQGYRLNPGGQELLEVQGVPDSWTELISKESTITPTARESRSCPVETWDLTEVVATRKSQFPMFVISDNLSCFHYF